MVGNLIYNDTSWRSILIHLWSESLNSNGQQFYQYQQHEQRPLASNHCIQNEQRHRLIESQILDWDKHTNEIGKSCLLYTRVWYSLNTRQIEQRVVHLIRLPHLRYNYRYSHWFLLVKLKSLLRKFNCLHHDLVNCYGTSVSQMTTNMFHL